MLIAAGLDWKVYKQSLFYRDGYEEGLKFGPKYEQFQNHYLIFHLKLL